jgi:hypothetical protein
LPAGGLRDHGGAVDRLPAQRDAVQTELRGGIAFNDPQIVRDEAPKEDPQPADLQAQSPCLLIGQTSR